MEEGFQTYPALLPWPAPAPLHMEGSEKSTLWSPENET